MKVARKSVVCANCGAKLQVSAMAGRTVVCPACKCTFPVNGVSVADLRKELSAIRENISPSPKAKHPDQALKDLPLNFGTVLKVVALVSLAICLVWGFIGLLYGLATR
jgi:predicted amidophosphoribosyltransferase